MNNEIKAGSKLLADQREKDIQELCRQVLSIGTDDTGDYSTGTRCPFCLEQGPYNGSMDEMPHELDCAYLIAKDLSTGYVSLKPKEEK